MSPSQTPQTTAQHSGMTAFFALIAAIFTHTSISALPVLPLASATSLTTVLKTFASSLLKGQSVATKASHGVRATDLLHHCTTNPPLDQHSTYLMTDMFDSLQGLAGAMTGSTEDNEREQKMIDFLGLDLAQSVADFWRDEWVAD